jgi:hypothetical protein
MSASDVKTSHGVNLKSGYHGQCDKFNRRGR